MDIKQLKQEYDNNLDVYSDGLAVILKELNFILKENSIKLDFKIEARIKEFDSIEEKIPRNGLVIESIDEINDLIGVRIICIKKDDIEKISKIINGNFSTIYQEDTGDRLKVNEFGYRSIHFQLGVNNNWFTVPSLKKCQNLRFELQLRTASQHIWAVISHKLDYKHESDVPPTLRRSINRMSALLEVCDNEYERIFNEHSFFINKHDTIESFAKNYLLDIEVLKVVLDTYLPSQNKSNTENYSSLLEDLTYFGITTKSNLIQLIEQYLDYAINAEIETAQNFRNSGSESSLPLFNFSGLTRLMLRGCYGPEALIEYAKINPKMF